MIISSHGTLQSSYSKIVKTGLVMWLDTMNDNSYSGSGTNWTNLAPVPLISGTLTNGPTFDGADGGSIVFDGVDDRVVIPNNINLQMGTSNYSIEAWVNYSTLPGNAGGNAGILFRKNTGATAEHDITIISSSAPHSFRLSTVQSNGTSNTSYTSSTAIGITTNTWYQFCITRDGTTISHYMTGSLIGTITGLATPFSSSAAAASASIGSAVNGNNRTTGKIAIVRIYKDKVLSADEVRQNYNADRRRFGL